MGQPYSTVEKNTNPPFINEEDGGPGTRGRLCVFAEVDQHPQPEVEL